MRLWLMLAVSLVTTGFLAQDSSTTQAQQNPTSPIWIGQDAALEEYLRTAEIERTTRTSVGVLGPLHAFFKAGGLVAGAAVKKISPGKRDGFFESYKSEIASYKLDRLLELNMVPTTVERRYENEMASAMVWIEDTKMLSEVQKQKLKDPNPLRWNQNLHRAQVFDDLSGNPDPNQGNWLFDTAWNFYKIDCSRCFIDTMKMPHDVKKVIRRIDRPFFERLKALDRDTVRREMGNLLTENNALPSLFRRRDFIVKAFEELAKENGEAAVFEAWHAQ